MSYIDKNIVSLRTNKMSLDVYRTEKSKGNIHVEDENYEITDIDEQIGRLDNDKADKTITINGYDLTENRTLTAEDIRLNNGDSTQEVLEYLDSTKADKSQILELLSDYIEYGVREVVGQSNTTLERVKKFGNEIYYGNATGLVANVGIDNEVVTNSFDNIPIFVRERVVIGVNIFVKVKKYYIKEEFVSIDGVLWYYRWMCARKLKGYRTPLKFTNEDGTENDYYLIGAYEGYIDIDGKLTSQSGVFPTVSTSSNDFRKAARKNDGDGNNIDSKYQQSDSPEYVELVQIPILIEFATKNLQLFMKGFTDGQYNESHKALVTESLVNRVVLTKAQASLFRIGQTIDIGTTRGGRQVARNRIITDIQVDTPITDQSTIIFDGEPVNVTVDNIVYNVANRTGQTDGIVANSGCYKDNSGKYSIVWRGMENPYGNIFKVIDGVKIVNHQAWVCPYPSGYNNLAPVDGEYQYPFQKLSYSNATNNGYVTELGYDSRFPFAKFPTVANASNNTYYSDYYYQAEGNRMAFVGGYWSGGSDGGPFCWRLNYSLGDASVNCGSRLSCRP